MIQRQAEIITSLRNTIRNQEKVILQLQGMEEAARFYIGLQKAIIKNPSLQSAWDAFMTVFMLTDHDEAVRRSPNNSLIVDRVLNELKNHTHVS